MSSPSGSSIEKEADTENKEDSNVKSNTVKGSKAGRRVAGRLSCLAFALGCVWILLFPLVTVTTGEAKPRGTFFDENAMLVHHTTVKLTAGDVEWAQPGPLSKAYPQVQLSMVQPPLSSAMVASCYDSRMASFFILPKPVEFRAIDRVLLLLCGRITTKG